MARLYESAPSEAFRAEHLTTGRKSYGRKSYGRETSLEEAKAAFRAEYDAWKGTKTAGPIDTMDGERAIALLFLRVTSMSEALLQ